MKGEKTINEIAQLYEVHPNQVSAWKGEIEEYPILALSKIERLEIYSEAFDQFEIYIRDDFDYKCVIRMLNSSYDPEELENRSLKEVVRSLFRYLVAVRAQEVGVTEKSMLTWCKRHGIGILRDDEVGDLKLLQRLGYHQRVDQPATRAWMQEIRASLKRS